jgi:hypothetical protein
MAKRDSTRASRITARITPSWLAAVGLVLSVTSMWQPRMPASADVGQRLALDLPTWILVGLAAAAVAMSAAIVSVLIRSPRRKDANEFITRPPRTSRLSSATIVTFLLPLGISIVGSVVALHLLDVNSPGLASSFGLPQAVRSLTPTRDLVNVPAFDFAVTVTLGAVTAVIVAFALLVIVLNQPWTVAAEWLSRSHGRKNSTLVAGLTSAMSTGIRELEVGDDPRSAVIACYRRCEVALALRRRRRYASETPREFVHEALAALKLPALAVESLLRVFEKARFSELPVTSSDRSVALSALGEIRSALERRLDDGAQP